MENAQIVKTNIINEGETNLTPIEVMLDIQSDGTTTAKKLYEYLQLDKKNYARWCKKNILENDFIEENVDFKPFVTNEECGGSASTDYRITAKLAKSLCMLSHTTRGEEARNYFIKVEDVLKEKSQKQNGLIVNDKIFFAQQLQQMTSILSQYMISSAKQMEDVKEEVKSDIKLIVGNSILVKDQQIEQTAELIGIRDKNTKYLTNTLKEKLSELCDKKITANNPIYIKVKNKIFRKYKVFTWESISAGKFNSVFADIDCLEKEDILLN